MGEHINVDTTFYRCVKCFNVRMEDKEIPYGVPCPGYRPQQSEVCGYCERTKMDGVDLLQRQLDVMDNMNTTDYPAVIRHLASLCPLKRRYYKKRGKRSSND